MQIIAGRAVAGVGAAFVMPATLSLLTVAYPKDERMKAVGIWAGTAGSGGVFGLDRFRSVASLLGLACDLLVTEHRGAR